MTTLAYGKEDTAVLLFLFLCQQNQILAEIFLVILQSHLRLCLCTKETATPDLWKQKSISTAADNFVTKYYSRKTMLKLIVGTEIARCDGTLLSAD